MNDNILTSDNNTLTNDMFNRLIYYCFTDRWCLFGHILLYFNVVYFDFNFMAIKISREKSVV